MVPHDGGLQAPITDNWKQGRTCFGGLTAALLLETALRADPYLPPLRSALVDFTGPVTEPATFTASVLRKGRNITTIDSRATIAGQTVATGNFTFGAGQDSAIHVECPAPEAPAPEETPSMVPKNAGAMAPGFHHNFGIRLIEGALPGMGSTRGYLRGWARHKDPTSRDGIVSLFSIGDIMPPAVFPLFPRIGPHSSVKWMFNVLDTDLSTEDGWWQVETNLTAAANGYSSQVMRVWSSDGRLIADGMQSVIVFV